MYTRTLQTLLPQSFSYEITSITETVNKRVTPKCLSLLSTELNYIQGSKKKPIKNT